MVAALVIITALAFAVRQPNRPPVITQVSVSSETAEVDFSLNFVAQATDPDGDSLTYSWNFGDGTTTSEAQPSHTFGLPGWYIVLLTVSDGKGGAATNDGNLIFVHVRAKPSDYVPLNPPTLANCPVTCVAGPGLAVLVANRSTASSDSPVGFTGNGSWSFTWTWNNPSNASQSGTYSAVSAAENRSLFVSFVYTWGDGTANTTGTSGQVGETTHTFASPGNYPVRLAVSNGNVTRFAAYTVRVTSGAALPQLKYPDLFAFATSEEPKSLDPAVANESAGGEVLQNVYETLLSYPQGSESVAPLTPRLAVDVPSDSNGGLSADGKNYTFNLRGNVTFHDGVAMTVQNVTENVTFSFRRVLAVHAAGGPSWILERILTNAIGSYVDADCNPSAGGIQNCTVGDWVNHTFASRSAVPGYLLAALPPVAQWDTTRLNATVAWAVGNSTVEPQGNSSVVFHLLRPYPAFLPVIASPVASIVSETCVNKHGGVRWGVPNAFLNRGGDCGSGPFRIAGWVSNQAVLLGRFNPYWRAPAKLAEVQILPVRDVVSREFMLLAGDADSAAIDRDHQWDVMNSDGTPKFPTLRIAKDRPAFDVSFFGYNQRINGTATPDPLSIPATFFSDVHIRRTFTYSFDYNAFIQNVTHDGGIQPRGPIPQGLLGYNASVPLFPFDLTQAAAELQRTAFWTSGFNLTLYYRVGNSYEEQGCRLLASGLAALHAVLGAPGAISVPVRGLDGAAYDAALRAGGLPLALLSWTLRFADPVDSVGPFLQTGSAFPKWISYSNATLDGLLNDAASEQNDTKRDLDYQNLSSQVVIDDVPYLWGFQATSFHVERAWVRGYYFNPMLSGLDYYLLSKA